MVRIYKTCTVRNSGEAYRRFLSAGFLAGAHRTLCAGVRRKAVAGVILLMGAAGLIGGLLAFLR